MTQPGSTPLLDQPDTDTALDESFRAITGYEDKLDDGSEKDLFSHYTPKEQIVKAAVEGTFATALCGKKWKPSRNPENYPVCPECKDKYEGLGDGDDGDDK